PHTVADKDGKAVIRERLVVITAAEVAMPATYVRPEPMSLPRPLPNVALPPAAALPSPALPSRNLPQGVHADGTPAELPPLPDDEKTDQSSGDSSEPRPSAQKHKSQPTAPSAGKPAGTADSKAAKAGFTLPRGLFKQPFMPQLGIPNLQF